MATQRASSGRSAAGDKAKHASSVVSTWRSADLNHIRITSAEGSFRRVRSAASAKAKPKPKA